VAGFRFGQFLNASHIAWASLAFVKAYITISPRGTRAGAGVSGGSSPGSPVRGPFEGGERAGCERRGLAGAYGSPTVPASSLARGRSSRVQLRVKKGPGDPPVPLDGYGRPPEHFADLIVGKAAEESQFDDPASPWIEPLKYRTGYPFTLQRGRHSPDRDICGSGELHPNTIAELAPGVLVGGGHCGEVSQQWRVHNTSGRRLRLGWPEYSHLSAPRHQRLRVPERSRDMERAAVPAPGGILNSLTR
jgi:hypothetical protein